MQEKVVHLVQVCYPFFRFCERVYTLRFGVLFHQVLSQHVFSWKSREIDKTEKLSKTLDTGCRHYTVWRFKYVVIAQKRQDMLERRLH